MGIATHAVCHCEEQAGYNILVAIRQMDGILIIFAHRPNHAQAAAFNFRDVLFNQGGWSPIPGRASPYKNIREIHCL